MRLSRQLRVACLAGLLLCTVGCDQTSKHLARTGLRHVDSVPLPSGVVELRLAENPGSFLSAGALLPDGARFLIFTLGVGVGLAALAAYLIGHSPIVASRFIGLSLVLAGGMGNLLDRVFRDGLVTDFMIIHIGPFHSGVFNVADVLIMVGVGVIIWTCCKFHSVAQAQGKSGRSVPPLCLHG
jgi:signal peptidase II